MLLSNLSLVNSERKVNILVENGIISSVLDHKEPLNQPIQFEDTIAFPGLINSHDHLNFNLFPQLGNRIYKNYVEWGDDIHRQNKGVIEKVLKVPKELRVQWGIYKNLLNGITTVVHHGPKLQVEDDLITVWQKNISLHSIQLDKKWKLKLNWPFAKSEPFTIHIGEGTDDAASQEIDKLIKWNLFRRELIGIHGIAMNEEQAKAFKAIVWCPASNHFLIGKTANVDKLKAKATMLFGTDSTLSASWSLWEHLRLARQSKMVSDIELFNMLTVSPSNILNIKGGVIEKGQPADIVICKKKPSLEGWDSFYNLNPLDILMVVHKGNIRLFDENLHAQVASIGITMQDFSKITIDGQSKYIAGNLPKLMEKIQSYYPEANFPVTA